jgi:hypothetical protein
MADELAVAVRSAQLAKGSWTVHRALEGHEANGMRATLTAAQT